MKSKVMAVWSCLFLALLFASACQPPAVDVEAETFAVKTVLENYFVAGKDKSIENLATLVDQNLVVLTPFAGVNFIGWEAYKAHMEPYFADATFTVVNYAIKDLEVRISRLGDAAWFHALVDEEFEYKGQHVAYSDIKWSGALEKYDTNWIITQMTFSFLRADEARLASYRTIIESENAKFSEAAAAGNLDALVEMYTADAVLLPPNSEILKGSDMVRATWQAALGQGLKSIVLTTSEVRDAGEFVCELGNYTVTTQPRGRRASTENGKFLVMWKPQPDGSLKIALDMWNTKPAAR